MKFNKVFKSLFLGLCFISVAKAGGLKLVAKHNVKVPEKFTVHSISGIFSNDSFILAYYAGREAYQHGGVATSKQCICITRGTPDNWQDPFVVASPDDIERSDLSCFDPVLFETNGKIYLFYRIGHSPRDWHGFVKISRDGGSSWTNPVLLPENILGPAKCKPLISEDGKDLICGSSFQQANTSPSKQVGWVSVDVLKNFEDVEAFGCPGGWKKGERIAYEFKKDAGAVVIQPAFWRDVSDERAINMLCRANTGKLVYSYSNDSGQTWANAVDSELPSNYSAISIEKLRNGKVFMAWNPLEKIPDSKSDPRWRLVVSELVGTDPRLSGSWNECLELEYDVNKKAEYSFPSIISVADKLFVAYGVNRNNIILAEVEMVN